MRWIFGAFLGLLAVPSVAAAVPDALVKRIMADPASYLDGVAVLIAGFGTAGAIDRAGLDNVVALARASGRAVALRRLQGADLDGDGAVTAVEIGVTEAASAAVTRGRLAVYFAKADADGNGAVSAAELQAYAGAAALAAYDEARAGQLRAVLGFDGNADGRVTLDEVKVGVAGLGQPPAAALRRGAGQPPSPVKS